MLAVGDIAPTTYIPTDTNTFCLARHHGKKMVIFFFPRADTSGCTKESLQFSDLIDDFVAADAEVIGISKDTPQKQAKFRAKYNLRCYLGADYNTDICEQFGVWVKKSMYGKNFMGVQRSSFIIDIDRKIIKIWPKVTVEGHAQDVLTSVKALRTK